MCEVRCKNQDQGEEDHNLPGEIPLQTERSGEGHAVGLEVKAAADISLKTPYLPGICVKGLEK